MSNCCICKKERVNIVLHKGEVYCFKCYKNIVPKEEREPTKPRRNYIICHNTDCIDYDRGECGRPVTNINSLGGCREWAEYRNKKRLEQEATEEQSP